MCVRVGEGHFSGAERVWAALEALLLLLLAVRECQLETRTISIMERIEEVIECKRQTRSVCGEGKEKQKKTGQQQQQKAVNILMQVWAARGVGGQAEGKWRVAGNVLNVLKNRNEDEG